MVHWLLLGLRCDWWTPEVLRNPDWEADTQAFQAGNYFMAGNFYTRHGQGNRKRWQVKTCHAWWSSSINNLGYLGSLGSNPILIDYLGFVSGWNHPKPLLPLFDDFTWYFFGFCVGFWDTNAFVKASAALFFSITCAGFHDVDMFFFVPLLSNNVSQCLTVFYIHFLVLYPDFPQLFVRFSRGGLKTTAMNRLKWSKQQLMPQIVTGGSGMVYGCLWMFMIYTCIMYIYICIYLQL